MNSLVDVIKKGTDLDTGFVEDIIALTDDRIQACSEISGNDCPACGSMQIMYINHDKYTISCRCRKCRFRFELERLR